MTRPKKEETLAKTKDVHLRMNETEYGLLAERAKANSMTFLILSEMPWSTRKSSSNTKLPQMFPK